MNTMGKWTAMAAGLFLLGGMALAGGRNDGSPRRNGGETRSAGGRSIVSARATPVAAQRAAPSPVVTHSAPRPANNSINDVRANKTDDRGRFMPAKTSLPRNDRGPATVRRLPKGSPDTRAPEPKIEQRKDRDGKAVTTGDKEERKAGDSPDKQNRDDRNGKNELADGKGKRDGDGADRHGRADRDTKRNGDYERRGDDHDGGHDLWHHDNNAYHHAWHWHDSAPWWARPTIAFYSNAPQLFAMFTVTEWRLGDYILFREYSYNCNVWNYWRQPRPFWGYGCASVWDEGCGSFLYQPYPLNGFHFIGMWRR